MILLWILVLIIVYIKMIDPGKKRKHPVLNVKYYAHRGFHGEEGIPENSMAAFKKAKGSGYGIELDVQLTKDGVMVVHHDYDLKRTCGVNKKITDLTYRELCRYRLMGTRERIPRFVEVLREVDGKVPLLVELKMETCNRKLCKKVAKALDQYKGLYCMECFHPYALSHMFSAPASGFRSVRRARRFPEMPRLRSHHRRREWACMPQPPFPCPLRVEIPARRHRKSTAAAAP